jgi:predicted aspartyl protease
VRRACVSALAACLVWPIAASAAPLSTLPAGHIATEARVNGRGPLSFIVDTAASNSALFPELRERLALTAVESAHGALHGASGSQAAQLFRIDSMEVDGRTMAGMIVVSLDTPRMQPGQIVTPAELRQGLVGADMLAAP